MSVHLITGATGYLGQALVRAFLERGDTVIIIIRGDKTSVVERARQLFPDCASSYKGRLLVSTGDVTVPGLKLSPAIMQLVRSEDLCLWHLAANLSFREADKKSVMKTNVDGTRNVVEFANRHASKFYHVSTAFVCGDTHAVFQENQLEVGQHFRNWYERSKYLAERIVRKECKVPFVVLRPSIIVGNACEGKASNCTFGYYRFTFMFYFLKRRLAGVLQSGPPPIRLAMRALGTRYYPSRDVLYAPWLCLPYPQGSTVDLVHIEDVVRAMVAVHTLEVPSGTTFHLTQPNPPSFFSLLKSFLFDLGLDGAKYVGLPAPLFRLFFQGLYYLFTPYRYYFRSILKYLPYISQSHRFSLENTEAYSSLLLGPITRDRLSEINRHAVEDVFINIYWQLYPGRFGTRPRRNRVKLAPIPSLVTTGKMVRQAIKDTVSQ